MQFNPINVVGFDGLPDELHEADVIGLEAALPCCASDVNSVSGDRISLAAVHVELGQLNAALRRYQHSRSGIAVGVEQRLGASALEAGVLPAGDILDSIEPRRDDDRAAMLRIECGEGILAAVEGSLEGSTVVDRGIVIASRAKPCH